MLDVEILERVRDWFQEEFIPGTTYTYDVLTPDDKKMNFFSYVKLGSEYLGCPIELKDLGYPLELKSWLTVHEASISSCRIDFKNKNLARAYVEVVVLKSKGDGEGESEDYKENATYYLLVYKNGDIDLWVNSFSSQVLNDSLSLNC